MIGKGRRVDGGLRGAVNEFFASANRYERGSKAQIFFDFAKVLSRTAESSRRKVVLFLDEFSEVRKVIERNEALNYRNPGRCEKIHPHEMLVDISFMHYFSSLLKSSELKQKVVFIFAVRPFMSEYDEKKELQVLKLTTPITLYYLDEDAAKELIDDPLRGKVDYEVGANDYLYRLTAGHPYLIQFILKTVVDRIRREGRATITFEDIKYVEEKMIAEGPAYDAHFAVIDSDYSVNEVLKEAWALLGRGTLALIAKFGDNQTERWVSSDAICQELKRYNINHADVYAMLSQLVRAKILEEELLNGDLYFRITMPLLHERYVKQNLYKKYFNMKTSSKL